MLEESPFIPHEYSSLLSPSAFPQGAVPEAAYAKLVQQYQQIDDVSVRRIAYRNDGLRITGLMSLPPEAKPGAHPLVIYNRGGNREYGKLTVLNALRELIPLARAGYAVFASNYRGNDGGEGRDEFGGAEVSDVLALLEIARARPEFDGKNAFLLGHSRGGMMTCLALKHGAKVRAAVSIAGIADLAAAARERPEVEKSVLSQLINDESREEALRARSAAEWPEKISAPLLLLHGDADDKVDVSHSQKLAAALAQTGKPHRLHIYPGGGHALRRDWPDVLSRVTGWFEAHRAEAEGSPS